MKTCKKDIENYRWPKIQQYTKNIHTQEYYLFIHALQCSTGKLNYRTSIIKNKNRFPQVKWKENLKLRNRQ